MPFVWRLSEKAWGGGRLQMALWIGVPAGGFFGLILFLSDSASPIGAVAEGIWFALIFGAWMTRLQRRAWGGADDLPPRDRVAVLRAVRRGEDGEPRLAPAIVDFADVVRRRNERDHRYRWVLWLAGGATLCMALYASLAGSTRSAVVWWVLVGYWALFIARSPRKGARSLARAERAESLA
jgi:hypothetical protein